MYYIFSICKLCFNVDIRKQPNICIIFDKCLVLKHIPETIYMYIITIAEV